MRLLKKKRRQSPQSIIHSHLNDISRGLLEGERRPAFLAFLKKVADRRGLYALYDKAGSLYYIGKASDLPSRLKNHLSDKHAEKWERMTMFFVNSSANIPELEGLIIASANPPGNTQKPRIGNDRRKELSKYLKKDASSQIEEAIYSEKEKPEEDELSGHITIKQLRKVDRKTLSKVLGVTQSRVSQLFAHEEKERGTFRKWIREAGKRDSVLNLLQNQKKG